MEGVTLIQGLLKGEVSLCHWPPVWLVWNQLHDYWQFLFLFAKQTNPNQTTGGQWYSDTPHLSIPCSNPYLTAHKILAWDKGSGFNCPSVNGVVILLPDFWLKREQCWSTWSWWSFQFLRHGWPCHRVTCPVRGISCKTFHHSFTSVTYSWR
jgi:hypothetical protein